MTQFAERHALKLLLIGLLLVLVTTAWSWFAFQPLAYYGTTDAPRFADPWVIRVETLLGEGKLYKDVFTTTPPLMNYLLIPPAVYSGWMGHINPHATVGFMLYFGLFNVFSALVLFYSAENRRDGYRWGLYFLLNPLTMGNAILRRQDESILVFVIGLAIFFFVKNRHWLGSSVVGAAILCKLTGGMILPVAFSQKRDWRYLVMPFVVFLVVWTPFFLESGRAAMFWDVTQHDTEHPFQIEGISLARLWLTLIGESSALLTINSVAFVIGVGLVLLLILVRPKSIFSDFTLLVSVVLLLTPKLHAGYFCMLLYGMTPLLTKRPRLKPVYFALGTLILVADLYKWPVENWPMTGVTIIGVYLLTAFVAVETRLPPVNTWFYNTLWRGRSVALRWWAVVASAAALHVGILWYNFTRVPLTYGYDWPGHFSYLFHLAETGQAPGPATSAQFFNPPLYYMSVVAFSRLTATPLIHAGLAFNFIIAAVTFVLLADIARRMLPQRLFATALLLGLFISTPTVYRTYGMMRPEALLLPLFVAAAWTVVLFSQRPKIAWYRLAVATAVLAGLATGVRQWGVFLEGALLLWIALTMWQQRDHAIGKIIGVLVTQVAMFGALFLLFYVGLRGGNPLAFNAAAQPFDPAFLTSLELSSLFDKPIRPRLNYAFWPTLYADLWGDYWRYWREAYGHDGSFVTLGNKSALVLSMWSAVVVTALVVVGLWRTRPRLRVGNGGEEGSDRRIHTFVWCVMLVTLVGFIVFATRYAEAGKGDTVKSIYIVYLVPFMGLLLARAVRDSDRLRWAGAVALAGLLVLIAPNGLYLGVGDMFGRNWQQPPTQHLTDATFADTYQLIGYTVTPDADQLTVELVWRADSYTGKQYKIFVQALDSAGNVAAQSDAVPAEWQRPTNAWMLGEYIIDTHRLALSSDQLTPDHTLLVGLYNESTGQRLISQQAQDHVRLQPFE